MLTAPPVPTSPTLRRRKSAQRVLPTEQGQRQGANACLIGIADMVGPGIFTLTFAYFIGAESSLHLLSAPFLLAAAMLATGALLSWRATQTQPTTVAAIE